MASLSQQLSTSHDMFGLLFSPGLGKPLNDFVNYLRDKHIRNCLPKDFSSGLAGIPVDHIYIDGKASIIPTTKTLPITGQKLSGKENYKSILMSFTTSDISPEEIYKIGTESLRKLYPKVQKCNFYDGGKLLGPFVKKNQFLRWNNLLWFQIYVLQLKGFIRNNKKYNQSNAAEWITIWALIG